MLTVAPCRRVKPPPLKKYFLGKTLNCIQWWGLSFEDLQNVEYLFIAIIPRTVVSVKVPSRGEIGLFEIYLEYADCIPCRGVRPLNSKGMS